MDYQNINRKSWNSVVDTHLLSELYDMKSFLNGRNSLSGIEKDLLGDITGKSVLHLQCHFGQDSISMARMGADVIGVDLSDQAITKAKELTVSTKTSAEYICSDIYDLQKHLERKFDIVFTSFGTIAWLPDLDKWAKIIASFLKPTGKFIFAEFHPVIWMYDDDFNAITYNYLNSGPIVETETGSYADRKSTQKQEYVTWNHGIGEVINSLVTNGLSLQSFEEFDYSPINCFNHSMEDGPGKFRIRKFGRKIPMVYTLSAQLTNTD